jgi:hypothetical protein
MVLKINFVCILLGTSPASNFGKPTFRNPVSVPSSRAGCEVWAVRGCTVFIPVPGFRPARAEVNYSSTSKVKVKNE